MKFKYQKHYPGKFPTDIKKGTRVVPSHFHTESSLGIAMNAISRLGEKRGIWGQELADVVVNEFMDPSEGIDGTYQDSPDINPLDEETMELFKVLKP